MAAKRNPNTYKNGSPRLRGMNKTQLETLLEKTRQKKTIAKIRREIERRYS
jgi:hypothetical protein